MRCTSIFYTGVGNGVEMGLISIIQTVVIEIQASFQSSIFGYELDN